MTFGEEIYAIYILYIWRACIYILYMNRVQSTRFIIYTVDLSFLLLFLLLVIIFALSQLTTCRHPPLPYPHPIKSGQIYIYMHIFSISFLPINHLVSKIYVTFQQSPLKHINIRKWGNNFTESAFGVKKNGNVRIPLLT